jgi:hypothetical protein
VVGCNLRNYSATEQKLTSLGRDCVWWLYNIHTRLPTQKRSVSEQYRPSHVLHTFHTGCLHRMYRKRGESVASSWLTPTSVVITVPLQPPVQNSNNYITLAYKIINYIIHLHTGCLLRCLFRMIFSLNILNTVCNPIFYKPRYSIKSFSFLGTGRITYIPSSLTWESLDTAWIKIGSHNIRAFYLSPLSPQ